MISHIQLNVSDLEAAVAFYLAALAPLGFRRADGSDGYVRISNDLDSVIVLCPVQTAYRAFAYHRRGLGLGHFALSVESRGVVDGMAAHLGSLGIPLLGEGVVEIGYRRGYYTLAFEDLDRIMVEIVHHDPFYFSALAP